MKKILCFLIVLFVADSLYCQPVLLKGGEIKDLKECVSKFCLVKFNSAREKHIATVCVDQASFLYFADRETGEKLQVENVVVLFNLMDREGWRYVDKFDDGGGDFRSFLFEKKETIDPKRQ